MSTTPDREDSADRLSKTSSKLKKVATMHNHKKIKVLCVCRGDVLRGPMMQARLQSLLDENVFRVESAGFERRSLGRHRVHPSAAACMHKRGIDIGKHESHYIGRLQHLEDYSVFVCVARDVAQRVQELLSAAKHSALVTSQTTSRVALRTRTKLSNPSKHAPVSSMRYCLRLRIRSALMWRLKATVSFFGCNDRCATPKARPETPDYTDYKGF